MLAAKKMMRLFPGLTRTHGQFNPTNNTHKFVTVYETNKGNPGPNNNYGTKRIEATIISYSAPFNGNNSTLNDLVKENTIVVATPTNNGTQLGPPDVSGFSDGGYVVVWSQDGDIKAKLYSQ